MSKEYTTIQYDTVDLIAYKHYGYSSGAAEEIYKANEYVLSNESIHLTPGTVLILPDIKIQDELSDITTIWG
jgi:phage tail protein X